MTLKSHPPIGKVDPIRYAWEALHETPLDAKLQATAGQRAGFAGGIEGKKGKGQTLKVVVR